ncbi:GAF domain-containing protein [Friedmanniella luteola]|uniref:GAF domain-containing protein n=1 Tax=Friedmanniella luteola TaxID=546871 RepID=A0A1H1SWY3_9ACTN|nr:GAF domain-containing protein [Friedmanniella luteola]SDS52492.1 GAF domain-containing protein [Friedmanniella luteola]
MARGLDRKVTNDITEERRLAALRSLDALDVLHPELRFDLMTLVAQRLFAVPMVSITLVDVDRQWRVSFCGPLERTAPRAGAVCPVVMWSSEVVVIPDLQADARFCDSPFVVGDAGLRFYAGFPLRAATGEPVGVFCLLDHHPRLLSRSDVDAFTDLGRWVQDELRAGVRDSALATAVLAQP